MDPAEKKKQRQFRTTDSEWIAILATAKAKGMGVAEWIRSELNKSVKRANK